VTLDDIKKRFAEEVKLRGYDDNYIDKNEEREILQIAIQQGVSLDSARGALTQVCEANHYIVESKIINLLKDLLDTLAGNDGKVDEKEFNDAVATCKKWTKGKRNDVQCRRMVIDIIDDNLYKTSKGWFSDWYQRAKKEVGK
jgi:hypothetical protein